MENYEALTLSIIRDLQHMPPWFNPDKYIEYSTTQFMKFLDQNPNLKQALVEVEEAPRKEKPRKLSSLANILKQGFKEAHQTYQQKLLENYLESENPFTMVVEENLYLTALIDTAEVFEKEARRLEAYIGKLADHKRITKHVEDYKTRLKPLVDELDKLIANYGKLTLYLDAWNSKDYSELYELKPLKTAHLNQQYLQQLHSKFSESLTNYRIKLAEYHPQHLQQQPLLTPETQTLQAALAQITLLTL